MRYINVLSATIAPALAVFIAACTTPAHKSFKDVRPGMAKDQVLELIGDPVKTQRLEGKDRWIYTFYLGENNYTKVVYFQEGIATYVGDPIKPPISAEEQDRINSELNRVKNLAELEAARKARESGDTYGRGSGGASKSVGDDDLAGDTAPADKGSK